MTMVALSAQTTQEIAANECGLDRRIETQQPAPCSHLEPITAVLRIGRELISQPMLIRAGLSDDIFREFGLINLWPKLASTQGVLSDTSDLFPTNRYDKTQFQFFFE